MMREADHSAIPGERRETRGSRAEKRGWQPNSGLPEFGNGLRRHKSGQARLVVSSPAMTE